MADPLSGLAEPDTIRRVRRLAIKQFGVVTRAQLIATGLTPSAVNAQLAARRWQRLNDQVVALHNGPLIRRAQMWAVLLSAQGPAALCSVTVLELFGHREFATEAIHIVVRRGARVLAVAGVAVDVHESRRFEEEHIARSHGLAVTSLSRSAIDAAVWSRDVLTAHRLLVAVVQRSRLHPSHLLRELDAAGRVRHRKTLRHLLADLEGGAQALSEVEFLAFCRRHGFPKPHLQVRLDAGGRRRYLDATFRRSDGSVVHVEVDGGVHLTLTARWKDTRKDNDALLANKLVLRFPSVAIYTDDLDAIRQIRSALCEIRRPVSA